MTDDTPGNAFSVIFLMVNTERSVIGDSAGISAARAPANPGVRVNAVETLLF